MENIEKSDKQPKKGRISAVAYLRTSSAANVGDTKDSEKRQRRAIAQYAKNARFTIGADDWFYDPAVSGADPIETRPGFNRLLDRIENNGVRTVIVEDASRFARELMVQELGLLILIKRGVRVITATGDELTDTTDPMKKMFRQIAGAFAELEKARLVSKLRVARERKRKLNGKCEGRKTHQERRPEAVKLAKELKATGLSLRKISASLASSGHLTSTGKPHGPSAVSAMLA